MVLAVLAVTAFTEFAIGAALGTGAPDPKVTEYGPKRAELDAISP